MTRTPARLVALAVPLLLAACAATGGVPTVPPATPTPPGTPTPVPTHQADAYPEGCPVEQPPPLGADETRTVTITTDRGDIVLGIQGALSPIAAGNFAALAACGFYDDVVFHRLVPGFVIQGGDGQYGRLADIGLGLAGTGGPPYRIKDEPVTTTYRRGTVAMARTSQPDSVGSQFFIVLSDAAEAPLASANTYQIIGTVTAGMDVVDAIAAMPNAGPPSNAALQPVAMTKVTVTNP